MAKEDSKVFDVAKPGESKPDTGSKPMVVGHKLMKDASVSGPEDIDNENVQPIAQTSKKTIVPISEQDKIAEKSSTDADAGVQENNQNSSEDKSAEKEEDKSSQNKDDDIDTTNENEKTKEEIEKEKDKEALDNEENLQKIVSDKTYFVSIDEASYSNTKTFLKTFILVALIAFIVIVVLIDLEILDLGVTLPFDFL